MFQVEQRKIPQNDCCLLRWHLDIGLRFTDHGFTSKICAILSLSTSSMDDLSDRYGAYYMLLSNGFNQRFDMFHGSSQRSSALTGLT